MKTIKMLKEFSKQTKFNIADTHRIYDAIAELEALQEINSCKTCKHYMACIIQSVAQKVQYDNSECQDGEKYFLPFSCSLHELKEI